ncbi:MAG: ferritin family protein [Nitrospiraceae bacterium]|nr:MAG: ferritin family protein [Nitrospiraceae bacterium]
MENYTVTEAMEQAIQTEKLGQAFYTRMAEKFQDNEPLKNLFDTLAAKERHHEQTFTSLKGRVSDQHVENWEEASKYMRAIVESEYFLGKNKSLPEMKNIQSIEDAVRFAIGFEKETLLYFHQMKDIVDDKETMSAIIKEEQSHLVWLSDFRKNL